MANRPQPPSFKTDVNRAKTKKWVDAKSPSYDDWPDDDEYGDDQYYEPPPPMPKPTGLRQRGQVLPSPVERGRNMTEPIPTFTTRERAGSFEAGDDRREFSTGSAPHPRQSSEQTSFPPMISEPGGFAPPPRGSSAATQPEASFPPRKSSLGQQQQPDLSNITTSESTSAPNASAPPEEETASPLAFIRPADIYKRMQAERERQSVDSNRPSMESATATSAPATESTLWNTSLSPTLPPVAERVSEYADDQPRGSVESQTSNANLGGAPPLLPSLGRFSTFGSDLWGGPQTFSQDTGSTTVPAAQTSNLMEPQSTVTSDDSGKDLQHQPSSGFRSVVRNAFQGDGTDRSTLSPNSARGSQSSNHDSGSGVSRSNTDSTAGISPILSQDPSAAKQTQERLSQTSPIQEEPLIYSPEFGPGTATSAQGSTFHDAQTTPTHSRNISTDSAQTTKPPATSGYRKELLPSSGRSSPAHAPVLETSNVVTEPSSAEMAAATPSDSSLQQTPVEEEEDQATPKTPSTGLHSDSRYSEREADLAAAVRSNPHDSSSFGEQEKLAQTDFIEQHDNKIPPLSTQDLSQTTTTSSGRNSPSKGRVRDLATKYNDITDRSATASPTGSVASWTSSNHNTGPPQHGASDSQSRIDNSSSTDEPSALSTAPLRPRLPGEWVSEVSNAPERSGTQVQDEEPSGSDLQNTITSSSRYDESIPATPQDAYADKEENVDFTPNKPTDSDHTSTAAMAAVAAAGAAVGASLTAAVGMSSKDSEKSENNREEHTRDASQEMVRNTSYMSVDPQPEDLESDKLRKDIFRTLTPDTGAGETSQTSGAFLSTGDSRGVQPRESTVSSLIPREYDSYWATSGTQSQNQSPSIASQPFDQPKATTPTMSSKPQFLKNRFSWETTEDDATPSVNQPVESSTADESGQSDRQVSQGTTERLKGLNNLTKLETSGPGTGTSTVQVPASRASREAEMATGSSAVQELYGDSVRPKQSADVSRASMDSFSGKPSSSAGGRPYSSTGHPVGSPLLGAKATPFKDIAAMEQPQQRIETFKQSREHFTTVDTGLSGWLTYMVATHPEHATAASTPHMPSNVNTGLAGTVRQKMPPTLAKLTKGGGSSHPPAQQPYYQQYLDSASQIPASNTNPNPTYDSSSTATPEKMPVSKSPNAKGKDFLQSASTGAKGLFAKGKSRFKGSTDKAE